MIHSTVQLVRIECVRPNRILFANGPQKNEISYQENVQKQLVESVLIHNVCLQSTTR